MERSMVSELRRRARILGQRHRKMFSGLTEEDFSDFKRWPCPCTWAYRTPGRQDQRSNSSWHIIVKTPKPQTKERVLKTARGKAQVTCNSRAIRITSDYSTETFKAKRAWRDTVHILKGHRSLYKILYPVKLYFKSEGEKKIFPW